MALQRPQQPHFSHIHAVSEREGHPLIPRNPALSVLVADASLPFRNQVRASLHRHPDLRLIAEADTGAAALHLFHKFRPDVALVDVSLPDRSGFEIVGCLRQANPDCTLLVLSHAPDALVRMAALWAGADHVFDKGGGLSGIIDFLRQTLEQRG